MPVAAEREAHPIDQREEPVAAVRWSGDRLGEALGPAGADLDLGGDQLAGGGLGQHLVLLAGRVDVLEAVRELERLRVEDRELLLEADREIGRGLESLPSEVEVEGRVRRAQAR